MLPIFREYALGATGWLSGHSRALSRLVCPPECAWCAAPCPQGGRFCETCLSNLVSDYYRCQRCATPLPSVVPNERCFRCRQKRWRFSNVITLGPYRGRLREAVILTKKPSYESLRRGLAQLLADQIGNHYAQAGGHSPWLVPVPNHWTRIFSRTATTTDSLAYAIGEELGWRVKTGLVRRIRKTAKQGMLSWSQREQNVRQAFVVHRAKSLVGQHVCLIDDVLTSGATAAEIAKCLIRNGAKSVAVAVIARGTGSKDRSIPN